MVLGPEALPTRGWSPGRALTDPGRGLGLFEQQPPTSWSMLGDGSRLWRSTTPSLCGIPDLSREAQLERGRAEQDHLKFMAFLFRQECM